VFWRIDEPVKFLQTVGDALGAEMRLDDIVRSTLAATLGVYDLSALLSVEQDEMQLEEVARLISDSCARTATQNFGIKVVDIGIKRLNFPQQNKDSVFERMRSERNREAKKYRAEGNELALKIRAEADKEATRIVSEAYKQAERIRGEGDAESTKIYADAHNRDPEFYKLVRTLEAYKKFLDDKTTVVLSSNSELLKLLTEGASH
jgi:membrane protease subunit HflC